MPYLRFSAGSDVVRRRAVVGSYKDVSAVTCYYHYCNMGVCGIDSSPQINDKTLCHPTLD